MDKFTYESFQNGECKQLIEKKSGCYIKKRVILAIMMFGVNVVMFCLRASISVTVVAATANKTTDDWSHFNWNQQTQGYIESASFVGNLLFQIPAGCFSTYCDGKDLYLFLTLGVSIISLFTGISAYWSVYALMGVRFIQGVVEAVFYPGAMKLLSKWSPEAEKSKFVTMTNIGMDIGTVLALPAAGFIATSCYGWPLVYYIFGGGGILFGIMFYFFVYESPECHPSISEEELNFIQKNRVLHSIDQDRSVPCKQIFTSLPFWSLLIANLACMWGYFSWLNLLPMFLEEVQHFSIADASLLSAIPHLVLFITSFFSSCLADCLWSKYNVSATLLRKLFIALCLVLETGLLIIGVFLVENVLFIPCIISVFILQGVIWCGLLTNILDISAKYSSVTVGAFGFISSSSGMTSAAVNGLILDSGGVSQWRIVLYVNVVLCLLAGIFYAVFGSGEDQGWDTSTK